MSGIKVPLNIKNANGRIFAMVLSGACVAVLTLGVRLPGLDTSIILASQLNVFMNYDRPDKTERLLLIMLVAAGGGIFQFVLGMLENNKFLILYAMAGGIFFILRALRRLNSEAITIIMIGVLGTTVPGGFLVCADRLIFILITGICAFLSTIAVQWIVPLDTSGAYKPPEADTQNVTATDEITLALMITCPYFLYEFFQMPEGYWIAFTILLIHSGGTFGEGAVKRAKARLIMTPLGLACGALLLGLCCWFDYRFAYLFPVFFASGYYMLFKHGSYPLNTFFQMIFFVLIYDILNGEYTQFDVMNILVSRWFAVMIGSVIIILGEPAASTVPRRSGA